MVRTWKVSSPRTSFESSARQRSDVMSGEPSASAELLQLLGILRGLDEPFERPVEDLARRLAGEGRREDPLRLYLAEEQPQVADW